MRKTLSIFNFKNLPKSFFITCLLLLTAECFVRSNVSVLRTITNEMITLKHQYLLNSRKDYYEGVIFGDSRVFGVNAKNISEGLTQELGREFNMYNFSFPNNGIQSYYFLLKKYIRTHKNPEVVFLFSAPWALTKNENISHEFKNKKQEFFRFVFLFSLKDCFQAFSLNLFYEAFLYKIEQASYLINYRGRIKKFFQREEPFEIYTEPILRSFDDTNGAVVFGYKKKLGSHEILESDYYKKPLTLDLQSVYWFEKFLELAKTENITIVIANAPNIQEIYDNRNRNDSNLRYINFIKEISQKYDHVKYVDPLLRGYDFDLFFDIQHLNFDGVKKFTYEIGPQMAEVLKSL